METLWKLFSQVEEIHTECKELMDEFVDSLSAYQKSRSSESLSDEEKAQIKAEFENKAMVIISAPVCDDGAEDLIIKII